MCVCVTVVLEKYRKPFSRMRSNRYFHGLVNLYRRSAWNVKGSLLRLSDDKLPLNIFSDDVLSHQLCGWVSVCAFFSGSEMNVLQSFNACWEDDVKICSTVKNWAIDTQPSTILWITCVPRTCLSLHLCVNARNIAWNWNVAKIDKWKKKKIERK